MTEYITVRDLLENNKDRLKLRLICSENGLNRKITTGELHRPGLALSGYVDLFTWDRIQILGNTEISYLSSLSEDELIHSIDRFIEFEIPVIIVTNDNKVPKFLVQAATRRYISIMCSPLNTTEFTHIIGEYLQNTFAPLLSVHGSLVDVYGIGILFTGRSGIGKSEIALDLIERGHRLVADDLVLIKRLAEDVLIGSGKDPFEHVIEVRGVGILDLRKIFGIRGVRMRKRVELEVHLVEWDKKMEYERVGLDENFTEILGVQIPQIVLPINPGKNITVISETIAMNYLLKMYGYNPAKEFNDRLRKKMLEKKISPLAKDKSLLEKDFE